MSVKHRASSPHRTKGGATFFESGGYILQAKRAVVLPIFGIWGTTANFKMRKQ